MDRRSWPWKKKSSDKSITDKVVSASDSVGTSLSSVASLGDQENYKKVNYVQISMDSYKHLTGLEGQFKLLEDEVKDLREKLSAAHSEIDAKDGLVKQHAKVSEEAVSGWEKADAEALALKRQLESVTLLKLTAEDRASHLDGALKECMRQIRNVKEESEHKLHEIILCKTEQWDKIKLDLEAKIVELDQGLLRAAAENAALSRSLKERSNFIVKINEEKSQAEAEIESLKENIQSSEKEISALKYELHMISKELDIRNEEKNMSIRSADVANKQHLESVKKVAKLEAECQRLRGLVRKKLPGPAALAQMKLEAENVGRDFSEPLARRTTTKNFNLNLSSLPEFSIDNLQKCHKETGYLTTRLIAMEEELKMLKETLATRNSELQTSRNMCAKTVGRLKSLEAQIQVLNQQRSSLKLNPGILAEGSSNQYASNPPSITSMSEDGIDEEGSSAESWAPVISDIFQLRRDKSIDRSNKPEKANSLKLMDDFLEMERLACLSDDVNGSISIPGNPNNARSHNAEDKALIDATKGWDLLFEQQSGLNPSPEQVSFHVKSSKTELEPDAEHLPLLKLQSRISEILESQTKDIDTGKFLENIKHTMQEILGSLPEQSASRLCEEAHIDDDFCSGQACSQDSGETRGSNFSLAQDSKPGTDMEDIVKKNLASAISQIHQFVLSLGREAMQIQGTSTNGHGLSKKLEDLSASVDDFIFNNKSLADFVLKLSQVFAEASKLNFNVLGFKGYEGDISSCVCIDKGTLLENKVVPDGLSESTSTDGCRDIPRSCSDTEVLQEGILRPGFGSDVTSFKCSLKDFEQLKSVKDNMAVELARCTQDLENAKLQLQEMEQLLTELKLQLASSERLHGLAETQLKCVTESYKSIEMHAQELEAQVNLLQEKTEKLESELLEEKHSHQNALVMCKDLQDKMQRNETRCSLFFAAGSNVKTKQEREIAAAAQKLAECQETMCVLSRQLQALRPQTEVIGSRNSERLQLGESLIEDKPKS